MSLRYLQNPKMVLTHENGTDRLSRNVGTTRCVISQKNAAIINFAAET